MRKYNDNYGSKRERQSILRVVAKVLFVVVTFISAVTLILALLAPSVNPKVWWAFPVLGLISPAVYLVNFAIAMVWLVKWRWKIALPIIFILMLGTGKVTRFAKIEIGTNYGETNTKGTVKLMSYNVRLFVGDNKQRVTKDYSQYIDSIAPDILCLQESMSLEFKKHMPEKLKKYNSVTNSELGVYSRFPIVAQSDNVIPTKEEEKRDVSKMMWVDIKIYNDTIRLFNTHMVTTTIKFEDDQYLTSREFIADSLREDKLSDIIKRYKNSSIRRAQHADSLSQVIASSPHSVIVCGDLNDTPMSYTYRAMSNNLNDAFQECGVGYSYTFNGFLNSLRIDYILASKNILFKSYTTDNEINLSDHYPITSRFTITNLK